MFNVSINDSLILIERNGTYKFADGNSLYSYQKYFLYIMNNWDMIFELFILVWYSNMPIQENVNLWYWGIKREVLSDWKLVEKEIFIIRCISLDKIYIASATSLTVELTSVFM